MNGSREVAKQRVGGLVSGRGGYVEGWWLSRGMDG
jgi:hypothetical protein